MAEDAKNTGQGMFAITTETKDKNNIPILVATKVVNDPMFPNGWKFPIANLVNVVSKPEYEKKDNSITSIIQFIFRDKDGRQHIHTEWALDTTDEKFAIKLEGMKVRIKHIYTVIFGEFPDKGIGESAKSFTDFFNIVEKTFNSKTIGTGEEERRLYPTVNLFIKLVYYKTNYGFPLSPNFLEKVVSGKPCKDLTINKTYDKLEASGGASPGGIPGMGGSVPSGDDLPAFDQSYT